MNLNLYELSKEFHALLEQWEFCVDDYKAEELEAQLNALDTSRAEKLENCCAAFKNYSAIAEAIKAEKQALAKRQQAAENAAERIRAWVQYALKEGEKLESPKHEVSWRASSAVEIIDESLIPLYYSEMIMKPRLKDIGAAIKSGAEVPGAKLVQRNNLTIK